MKISKNSTPLNTLQWLCGHLNKNFNPNQKCPIPKEERNEIDTETTDKSALIE